MDESRTDQASDAGPAALPVGIVCPDCGYDLRGSTSARCPECGFGLDVLRTRETLIPWSHRRELGWFKAYWKTVWLVLRRPKQLCLEMARPVSYGDSQSFRWLTTLHAYVPIVIGAAIWYYLQRGGRGGGEGGTWFLAALVTWVPLALILLPGLASYFFQPRGQPVEQQNRAIALSYYAWAPLALLSLATPLPIALALLERFLNHPPRVPVWHDDLLMLLVALWATINGLLSIGAPLLAYARLLDITWRLRHRRDMRGLLRIALLWLLSAVLVVLLGLPLLCAFYLLIIYHSLR